MKKRLIIFYVIITVTFFGILLKQEYATDTYAVFNFDSNEIYMQFAMSGRFVTAIIGKILKIIRNSESLIYLESIILALICAILSQYKLYQIIKRHVKDKKLRLLIPILVIINPFSIELFLFIEKGIMWFGILMSILAVDNVVKFFEIKYNNENLKNKGNVKKKLGINKYIFFAIIFMFIANCSYQGIVGIFVSISLVYILKYSKNIKQFILNNIIVALIYGLASGMNLLLVKILFKSARLGGKINLRESFRIIYTDVIDMYKYMYNLLPKYVFIFAILFTFTVFCCKIWKDKKKFLKILKFLYLIIGITFVAVAPMFFEPTTSIWFVPRATYCFASMYGILLLYLSTMYEFKITGIILILLVSIIIVLLQIQKFYQVEQDRYILNQKDEEITMRIIEEVEKYEANTGIKITQMSVYNDKNPNYTYEGIKAFGDTNIKCYVNDWSAVQILNYFLKRNLKLVQEDDKISQNFSNKDWDKFNVTEQIIFKDDTLIICNY